MSTLGYNGRRTFFKIFILVVGFALLIPDVLQTLLTYKILNFIEVQTAMAITCFVLFVWLWKNWA